VNAHYEIEIVAHAGDERIASGNFRRERGYVYWLDSKGNMARVRRGRLTIDQIAEMCRANARHLDDPEFAALVDRMIDEPFC
jgi:hypothetical protein